MASVYRRPEHRPNGPWTARYKDAGGKWRSRKGYASKAETERLARHLEDEASKVRAGLVDPRAQSRREAELRPVADHVEDYRRALLAKGDTARHAAHTAGALRRVLADANVRTLGDLDPVRVQEALGRLKAVRSARTCNHALGAVKAWAAWLHDAGRLAEVPRGLRKLAKYNEEADRKRVRRALTPEQLDLLIAATEAGPTIVATRPGRGQRPSGMLTGLDRAILYRLAAGTGFRANELRTLTPECFRLDGEDPSVVVRAAYAKNGREAVQPIRRELADRLRPWLATREPGVPVLAVPVRTAEMLADDLRRAGIPYRDAELRVADFHSLRAAYITGLVRSGVDPATAQRLARHSDVRLTLSTYTTTGRADMRKALEGGE
jgi:integrase